MLTFNSHLCRESMRAILKIVKSYSGTDICTTYLYYLINNITFLSKYFNSVLNIVKSYNL